MKTVIITEKQASYCFVKARLASGMSREEVESLMSWCDGQAESLWIGLTLQEILNVYRASADYDTWEGWAEEDWQAAHKAWNAAVINKGNRMIPLST